MNLADKTNQDNSVIFSQITLSVNLTLLHFLSRLLPLVYSWGLVLKLGSKIVNFLSRLGIKTGPGKVFQSTNLQTFFGHDVFLWLRKKGIDWALRFWAGGREVKFLISRTIAVKMHHSHLHKERNFNTKINFLINLLSRGYEDILKSIRRSFWN